MLECCQKIVFFSKMLLILPNLQNFSEIFHSFLTKLRLQSCAKECIVQISARAFKRIFTCKIWLRYSRERALQSFPALRIDRGRGSSFSSRPLRSDGGEAAPLVPEPDDPVTGRRRGAPGRSRRGTSFLFSACVAQNYRRLLLTVWIFLIFFVRGVFKTIFSKTPPLRLSFAAHSRFSIHCGQIIRAAHVSFSLYES